jgi:curved DNA-binding protein CbpA
VASLITFIAWAESLETMNYYDILRVSYQASPKEIQEAFHEQSLRCHPDRFVDEPEEVAAAAAVVFKRLVEAYNILRRPPMRKRYDEELAKVAGTDGAVAAAPKFDEHAAPQKKNFEQRTLFQIAKSHRARHFAAQADRLLSIGDLEGARVQLVTAYQNDPGNAELKERLDILYEALALEPF